MRKILVANRDGQKTIEAEHYATFAAYVEGTNYQFVVTRAPGEYGSKVTHRKSGYSLGPVESSHVAAANFDQKEAGKLALAAIIAKHGEARVAGSLRRIESNPPT